MNSLTVAMIQSNYLPWKGYFDQINMADVFVFYDDVQYTKEDWRNRNLIKTPTGPQWMTVPCGEDLSRRICDVTIDSSHWQRKHWRTLVQNYRRADHFQRYSPLFEPLYLDRTWTSLSELNQTLVKMIAGEILGITTEFRDSREFDLGTDRKREDRWLDLLEQIGATELIAGPKARDYLHGESLKKVHQRSVEIAWMDYSGYPEYPQLYPPFDHHVSIVDLIFNVGPAAASYMKSFEFDGRTFSTGRRKIAAGFR